MELCLFGNLKVWFPWGFAIGCLLLISLITDIFVFCTWIHFFLFFLWVGMVSCLQLCGDNILWLPSLLSHLYFFEFFLVHLGILWCCCKIFFAFSIRVLIICCCVGIRFLFVIFSVCFVVMGSLYHYPQGLSLVHFYSSYCFPLFLVLCCTGILW